MKLKDFKAGMVAGAKPFEEKMREIQNANIAAVQKLASENSNSIGELIDIAEEHDYLLNYEWKKEYELSSFAEKAIFLGLFKFCIKEIEGSKHPEDNQKLFFNNLCNTFQIDPFQIREIEISRLKNNQDVSFQNLLYMSICNYFYITFENFKFEKQFEDEIFQYFRVSKNDKNEIHELIKWTNDHLSLDNMLSYTEEQQTSFESSQNGIGCSSLNDLEDYTINELMFIKEGEERIISNKKIVFNANAKIDGKGIFKNCYINYGINDSFIEIDRNGELIFENCVFTYKNNDAGYFIISDGKVTLKHSLLEDCWWLCYSKKDIEIENSKIIYNTDFYPEKKSNSRMDYCLLLGKCIVTNSYISGANIEFAKGSGNLYDFYIFSVIKTCTQTIFENCIQPARAWGTVSDSKFTNSNNIFEKSLTEERSIIKNSEFTECESIVKLKRNSNENHIDNCKFINCCNCLIEMEESNLSITGCEFRNLRQNKSASYILITAPKNNILQINKSIFDGLSFFDFGYLIHIDNDYITGVMTEKDFCQIKIEDCMFGKMDRRTSNPVIDKYCVCVASKLSLKTVLDNYNNTGIDDLLNKIQLQVSVLHLNKAKLEKKDFKINNLEPLINAYLPRICPRQYYITDTVSDKQASKKIEILRTLIPNLDQELILGFADLSKTGNANDYLVFTSEQCYYHNANIFWTYYYNHPEISESAIYEDKEERHFNLKGSSVNNNELNKFITLIEDLLK